MARRPTARLEKDGAVLVASVELAHGLLQRIRGLLGRRRLPAGRAMHLRPCPAIHTVGMQFSLDVVFLDGDMRVVRIVRDVAPFRMVGGGRTARSALEMQAGWFPAGALGEGDVVALAVDTRAASAERG